ncbi:MAG: prepilin-type N-terminal cleavage/methylation domain-containing protein, partial [Azoarcus sp.]|nr:prepilin-type N-terminal cleavage/methylation domain-containing protein [Azoarcus sp.]
MTSTLNPASCRPSTVRHTQRGFTLVELMIAVVISLLILIALVAVFLNTSRTNTEMARTNSIIENGRFAMQVLQDDVVHAGYWGQYVPQYDDLTATGIPTDVPTEAPAVCTAYAAWDTQYRTNLIGVPVQAFSDVPPGCDAVVADRKADTDVLVVRRVETCVAGSTGCAADVAGTLYFQSSLCASDPAATPYVLDTTGHTLRTRACSTILSPKRRFVSSIYYVRTYSEVIDDNIPTLVRSRFDSSPGALAHQDPVPLVEGIEGFKVQLGIDARSRVDLAA